MGGRDVAEEVADLCSARQRHHRLARAAAAELARYDRDVDRVREGLGEHAFTAAWEAGRATAADEVISRYARA